MLVKKNLFVIKGDEEIQRAARRHWEHGLTKAELGEAELNDIHYLLIENENGGQLLEVDRWTIKAGMDGTKTFELGFSRARGYRSGVLDSLKSDPIDPLMAFSNGGRREDMQSGSDGIAYKLSMDDARIAVANYYGVDALQIAITITG